MSTATPIDGMHFLTQSAVRVRILELLYESENLSKRDLKERIDASRVTVRRNVIALEERDLISVTNRTCESTVLGDLVVEDVLPSLETAAVVELLRPFVRWFPEEFLEFDVRALDDATIVVSEPNDPYAPVNRHIEALEGADRFRGLLSAIGLPAMTIARDRVVEGECDHEVITTPEIGDVIATSAEYRTLAEAMLKSGNCELFVSDEEIPFYLGLFDQFVQIGVEDDDGVPKVLVQTDADEIREWAEQTYDRYLEAAEPFTL